jgi:hypothetical protein
MRARCAMRQRAQPRALEHAPTCVRRRRDYFLFLFLLLGLGGSLLHKRQGGFFLGLFFAIHSFGHFIAPVKWQSCSRPIGGSGTLPQSTAGRGF